jgi:hypothetical protein
MARWLAGQAGAVMADLRVDDATVAKAQTTFRTAADHLGPAVWAVKGLNDEVVGADPLSERLRDAHGVLAAGLEIIGQALTQLAGHVGEADAAFGDVDQALSRQARGAR